MNLSPLPVQKFFSNIGLPLVGGKLFTYAAGTSTKIATYQNESGTLNANPIILNFRGEANIWLDPTLTYKFVLAGPFDSDPPTNPIWSVDDIAAGLTNSDITQQFIGQRLWPRTVAEIAAGVTPVNYAYEPSPIDPRRYGLSTGGTPTDNTSALDDAIAVAQNGGGEILIREEGTYNVNKITFRAGAVLRGSGWKTILKLAANVDDHLISWDELNPCDDAEIADIQLDGNKANNTGGAGVSLVGARIRLRNLYVHDTVLACILIQGAGGTTTSDNCTVEDCFCVDPGQNNDWGAIAGTCVKQFTVRNCWAVSTDGEMTYGIDVEPNTGEIALDIVIQDNTVIGGRIFVDSANTTAIDRLHGCKISGNYVDARGSRATNQQNGAPIFCRYVQTLDITGNTLIGDNNTSVPYSPYGGAVFDGCNDFSFKANTIYATDVTGDEYAVLFDHNVDVNTRGDVLGNTFINAGAGSYRYAVYAPSAAVTELVVGYNSFGGSWSADSYNVSDTASSVAANVVTTRRVTVDFSSGGALAAGASRSVNLTSGFSCSPGDICIASDVGATMGSNTYDLVSTVTNTNVIQVTLTNRGGAGFTPGNAVDLRLCINRYRVAGTVH